MPEASLAPRILGALWVVLLALGASCEAAELGAPWSPKAKPPRTIPTASEPRALASAPSPEPLAPREFPSRERIVDEYGKEKPLEWGTHVAGARWRVGGEKKTIALTLDACGGRGGGDGYEAELVAGLRAERVPATLFMTSKWLRSHPEEAKDLAADKLFELENHGDKHRPCSVTGRSAFGIRGTRDAGGVVDEIEEGAFALERLTGKRPRFFRPGTAFADDVCVKIAGELGFEVVGYTVAGDGGASFSGAQIFDALTQAESGSIVVVHMNRSRRRIGRSVLAAVADLRARGFELVKLEDVKLE